MPLLKKEPFQKAPIPPNLRPDDEVFFIAATGEIFADYDEFFKRTILLNSLVWTCSVTGRSGLTFEEALKSERSSQDNADSFPENLERPLMYMISMTQRGRIDDLVFDLWSFCRERYLISELVEVCYNGSKTFGQILSVKYTGDEQYNNDSAAAGTSSKSDDEQEEVYRSGRRKPKADYRAPLASNYLYEVAILPKKMAADDLVSLDASSPVLASCPKAVLTLEMILRRRFYFTKQKCRVFVKNICEPVNGCWVIKDSIAREHRLNSVDWSRDVFGGPKPVFRRTPASRRSVLAHQDLDSSAPAATGSSTSSKRASSDRHHHPSTSKSSKNRRRHHHRSATPQPKVLTEQELKMRQIVEKQQMALASLIDECNRYNVTAGGAILTMNDFPLDDRDPELNEQILAELRERAKKAKDEEKERARELRRREKEAILEWRKPRDDLQCDDHRPLPELPRIHPPSFIPRKYFGDVLALLEFLNSFGDELNLKEYFPPSKRRPDESQQQQQPMVSLSTLYEALRSKDMDDGQQQQPQQQHDYYNGSSTNGGTGGGSSVLTKLFKALLDQVFRRLTEEDGDEANLDNREDFQHDNCDLEHPFYGKTIEDSTRASENVRNTHGMSVRHLPMDTVTLTELLRLHLSASGYYPGTNPGRFRYQARGGYRCWDDPGMTFRNNNPELMEELGRRTIFELDPVSRLKLLTVLSNQLLLFSSMRQPLQQKTENLQALRHEIRQVQMNDQKNERESLTAKLLKQEARAAAEAAKEAATASAAENGGGDQEQQQQEGNQPKSIDLEPYDPEKPSQFVQRLRRYLPKTLPKNERGEIDGQQIVWESIDSSNQERIKQHLDELDYDRDLRLEEIDDVRAAQRQIFFADERRLVEEIYRLQTACGMVAMGRDRAYRKYDLLASLGAIVMIKYDQKLGECPDTDGTPIDRIEPIDQLEENASASDLKRYLYVCTGRTETCPVHVGDGERESTNGIVENGGKEEENGESDNNGIEIDYEEEWYLLHTKDELDRLIHGLNRRGFRELELSENLDFFRPILERAFDECPRRLLLDPDAVLDEDGGAKLVNGHGVRDDRENEKIKTYCEETLKEGLLDFEERIASGNFGGLKGRAREQWRQSIERNAVVQGHPELFSINSSPSPAKNVKTEATPGDSDVHRKRIRAYAKHLLDLVSALHTKSYRKAFMDPHGRYVEGEFIETGANTLDLWKSAVGSSTSYAQLHLHVCTLDAAVSWNKSSSQMKCRLCRRKGDAQTFLECEVCERLYHNACLRPPPVLGADRRWTCPDCSSKAIQQQQQAATSAASGVGRPRKGVIVEEDEEDVMDVEDEEYCERCQNPLTGGQGRGRRKRFVCASCSAVFHPTCAIPSGSIKLSKQELARWKCERCAPDDAQGNDSDSAPSSVVVVVPVPAPAPAAASITTNRQRRSMIATDGDTGSSALAANTSAASVTSIPARRSLGGGNQHQATELAAASTTRTGRIVKKPKTFEDMESDPSKSPKKKLATTNGTTHSATSPPRVTALTNTTTSMTMGQNWQTDAKQLLSSISSHPDSWPFRQPVTKKIAPDYFTIIKTPMDLGTIRTKLLRNTYKSRGDFVDDLELIFENCRTYNAPTADVSACGTRLHVYIKQQIDTIWPDELLRPVTNRRQSDSRNGNGSSNNESMTNYLDEEEDEDNNTSDYETTRKRRKK